MPQYNHFSDQELTALLKKGDMAAFDQIYDRYAMPLYQFAYTVLKEEDTCTDAIQDIFIWLWQHKEVMQITAIKPYLFAAVKFNLARLIRTSRRRTEILDTLPRPQEMEAGDPLELKELKALIAAFVSGLPERAREVFVLSRNEYLSNQQIAEKLGISEKTVENQMTITLRKLRINLNRHSFWSVFL